MGHCCATFVRSVQGCTDSVEKPGAIIWLSTGIVLGNLAASFALINGVGPWQGLNVAGAAWVTLGVNAVAAVALQSVVLQSGHVNLRGFDAMLFFASSPTLSGLGWASCAPRSIAPSRRMIHLPGNGI